MRGGEELSPLEEMLALRLLKMTYIKIEWLSLQGTQEVGG